MKNGPSSLIIRLATTVVALFVVVVSSSNAIDIATTTTKSSLSNDVSGGVRLLLTPCQNKTKGTANATVVGMTNDTAVGTTTTTTPSDSSTPKTPTVSTNMTSASSQATYNNGIVNPFEADNNATGTGTANTSSNATAPSTNNGSSVSSVTVSQEAKEQALSQKNQTSSQDKNCNTSFSSNAMVGVIVSVISIGIVAFFFSVFRTVCKKQKRSLPMATSITTAAVSTIHNTASAGVKVVKVVDTIPDKPNSTTTSDANSVAETHVTCESGPDNV
jgi:hypothetical protein